MNEEVNRRESGKVVSAGIAGALYGGISSALIGGAISGSEGALIGGIIGAVYFGLVEAITDARRKPGELKPLWHRLIGSMVLGAAAAAVLSTFIDSPFWIGLIIGVLAGLVGLGLRKLALGMATGLVVGLAAQLLGPSPDSGMAAILTGAGVVLIYRLLLLTFFKGSAPVQLTGERVPADEARYVVPFEAHTKSIGAEYMKTLARDSDGAFIRNKDDIGIVATLDALRGPNFDPTQVDPLIREFYEHTTRFNLSIEPEWNPFIKPFFWMFKTFIAQRIGQANLPFNTEEAQRGMVSYVDSIDYQAADDPADHIETLRGWIRAYEDTGEAIYVGIYTVVRHDGVGYVSVGFPLPEANFTATLMPYNNRQAGLLLKTRDTGSSFPGHYLTDIDDEDGSLTILELPTMGEEIDVYISDGQLRTDHRFYFGGYRFLTLHYSMERKGTKTGS